MPNILLMISRLCWTFEKSKLLFVCKVGFVLESVRIKWFMVPVFSAFVAVLVAIGWYQVIESINVSEVFLPLYRQPIVCLPQLTGLLQ